MARVIKHKGQCPCSVLLKSNITPRCHALGAVSYGYRSILMCTLLVNDQAPTLPLLLSCFWCRLLY
jgi:hypothetical protein